MLAFMQLRQFYRTGGTFYRAANKMVVSSKAVTPFIASRACVASTAAAEELPHSHAKTFLVERILAAGMVPLFATSLFVHNVYVDYTLACAVALHVHW
ncbi:unnamed protein product [Soboliphyme baturini]|uniref:Succinate dehydrogenase [ubiquinone] cytochrome b small subunit n=1 Tax=Soboliphyme baturini TaxID=241478 RepID=A0A183J2P5_9BILA|nr:unnamed protein product [Soboliphyme baturini]